MKNKVVIDAWVSDLGFVGYMDQWMRLADEFNKAHPDYQVNVKGTHFFTGPHQVAEAIAEGHGPTIAEYYFYLAPTARDMLSPDGGPYYTSIEKAIGGRTEILGEPVIIDDIISGMREYYTYQGDLFSLPSVGTTSLLYGNVPLLEKAGLSEMPETWEETVAACQLVAQAGLKGVTHPITWSNQGMVFQQAIASQGGLLCDNNDGRSGRATKVDLASKEMLAWVTWWQQLHADGHYLYTGKLPDWEGTFRAFAEQQVAFRISSSNDVSYMAKSAEANGFSLVASRFPYNDKVPYSTNTSAGTSLCLANGLDEATQDGALAFLMYSHNPRNAAERHRINSFVPLTHGAYDLLKAEGWFDEHPYHQACINQLSNYPKGTGRTGTPTSGGALFGDFAGNQDVMCHAMADVLLEGIDPVERFTRATVDAQKLLDDYYADCAAGGPSSPSSLRVEYFSDVEPYSGADMENVVQLKD